MQKAMIFDNAAVIYVNGNAYRINFGTWAKMMQLT